MELREEGVFEDSKGLAIREERAGGGDDGWSSLFAGGIDGRKGHRRVVEHLFGAEETVDFDLGILGRVGGVDDVFLTAHAEVAPDGSGKRLAAVGGAYHGADNLHGVDASHSQQHYRRGHHRSEEAGEEGSVNEVGVMLAQDGLVKTGHLHAGYDETLLLEAAEDAAYKAALNARGFDNYQCGLHRKVKCGLHKFRIF